jgi:hypothetical protein
LSPQAAISGAGVGTAGHRTRSRRMLPFLAFTAAMASLFVLVLTPYQSFTATAATGTPAVVTGKLQSLRVAGEYSSAVVRDSYGVTKKVVAPRIFLAAAVGVPDPGTAQAIGYELVKARGWGDDQFACLVSLFNRESHWNVYAANPSGAYGIPQALPGSKMASAGADWQTNPRTQIAWGLNYIQGRYLTPCGAWGHSQSSGWY